MKHSQEFLERVRELLLSYGWTEEDADRFIAGDSDEQNEAQNDKGPEH